MNKKLLRVLFVLIGFLPEHGVIFSQERTEFKEISVPDYSEMKADLPQLIEAELNRQRIFQELNKHTSLQWDVSWPTDQQLAYFNDFYEAAVQSQQDQYLSALGNIYHFLYKYKPAVQNIRFDGNINEQNIYPIRTARFIKLFDFEPFKLNPEINPGVIKIENTAFDNYFEIQDLRPLTTDEERISKKSLYSYVRLDCTEPVNIQLGGGRRDMKKVKSAAFVLYRKRKTDIGHKIFMPDRYTNCEVKISHRQGELPIYGFSVQSDTSLDTHKLSGRLRDICVFSGNDADRFGKGWHRNSKTLFNSMSYTNSTCPESIMSASDIHFLNEPFDGLNAKVRALAGTELPSDIIASQDISYKLDMSNAPKLDYIFISTLEFKNDYYGNVLSGLLLWHARRGAGIKIILPGISYFLKDKDKALLENLQKSSPNIEVQYFVFNKISIHHLHRVIHSKLFITLSLKDPSYNSFITGGRNIKDSFVFYGAVPDYSSRPEWIKYGSEESYIYYWDLEVEIRNPEVPLQAAAQFLSVWNRDFQNHHYRPSTIHIPGTAIDDNKEAVTKVRHILSVPYVDSRQMEKVFTDFLYSAKESVKIASPYFRLPKDLKKAMHDAIRRGVKIEFITRLKLAGDNTPFISEDVNKKSVNEFFNKIDIYEWTDSMSILHVKAMLVDDNLLYVGATNMNERSFNHDIESGLILFGEGESFTEFKGLFENVYKKRSRLVKEKQKLRFFSKLIIPILGSFF
jgi:phosphatidylserine/phosphatidylglycerophosphate/cardiolipin synthase-like enzyme